MQANSTHLQFPPLEVDARVRLLKPQIGRDLSLLNAVHGFDEPSETGGCFEVADVGLDGADEKSRLLRRPALAKSGTDGAALKRISHRSPCTIMLGLNLIVLFRQDASASKGRRLVEVVEVVEVRR